MEQEQENNNSEDLHKFNLNLIKNNKTLISEISDLIKK